MMLLFLFKIESAWHAAWQNRICVHMYDKQYFDWPAYMLTDGQLWTRLVRELDQYSPD